MIRLKIRDTFHRLIDGYEINESSREVKFSDLKLDFTDKTIADLPLKYQECQLVDVDLEDIEQSSGRTDYGVNMWIDYDDKRNFSYRLEGSTYQETTTGKNLFTPDLLTQQTTFYGLTITPNSDGTITINGTSTNTSAVWLNLSNYNYNINNVGFWVSSTLASQTANGYTLSARITNGTLNRLSYNNNNKYTAIQINPSSTFNNAILYVQMEQGTSATNWEAYTGKIASPNPSFPQEVQTISGRQQISIMGKNLFDKDSNIINGKTYTNTGTLTNLSNCSIQESYIKVNSNWDYTLSTTNDYSDETDFRLIICEYDKNKNFIKRNIGTRDGGVTTEYSITTENNTRFVRLGFTTATIKELLFKSGTSGSYDVYRGKIYEINLGKNLFNLDTAYHGTINASGVVGPNESFRTSDYIETQPGAKYYFSSTQIEGTSNKQIYIAYYNVDKTFVSRTSYNLYESAFTTPANCYYMRAGIFTANQENVMLEKGSQKTSYVPYKEPIELNNIDGYQDVIFKNGVDNQIYYDDLEKDTWYLLKRTGKVVFTNTTSWYYDSGASRFSTTVSGSRTENSRFPIYSNYFHYASSGGSNGIGFNYGGAIYLYNYDYTSVETFQTWLGTHNTSVYYILATPTITKIEDEELINQLEAVKLISGFNDISTELFDVSPILHIHYNYNEAYTWSKINEIIYTGYVNNFILPSMKNKKEYRELELELLSPLAMATLRTVDVSGRYNLKDAITNILQPLIDEGFNLIGMNIYDVPVNVNYLAETIESAMNKLSNNYNFWWYIDKNKNIFINSISYLLSRQALLNYTNDLKLSGLIDFIPRTNATDYCNTVCFSNVRIYRNSYYKKHYGYNQETQEYDLIYYDLYYPLVNNIYKIKDDDNIEFNHPIDLYPERTLDLSNVYNTTILEIYSIVNHSSSLLAYVRYEYGRLVYSNNVSIDGNDNTKAFQLTLSGENNNLITGFKYSGTDFELGEIISDVSLPLLKVRFIDNIEADKNKNIINESGIVEKMIDMNERITTYDNLLNIANSLMRKNKSNVEEIEMKFDGDLEFEVGNIISVNRDSFLTNGKFIVIDKKTIYSNNVKNWVYTLRNTRILENYVDLFRAAETYENQEQEKTYIITANVAKEEIKESYEVENES